MIIFFKSLSSEISSFSQYWCLLKEDLRIKSQNRIIPSFVLVYFLSVSVPVFSQTLLSGTINHYSKVVDINYCESKLIISDASSFSIGDQVLLIQMKGTVINESNTSAFGDLDEIGGAGLMEKNEIVTISGNEIYLKYLLANNYEVTGAVQLVSFPKYELAVVSDKLSAENWDGEKGGVLAFEVENELTLSAAVEVDGKGFRGATTNTLTSDCTFLTNADGYHYSISNWRGAPKGEGITNSIQGKEQGRGALANGGGGGNDHNAGGGGGANITNGGGGGKTSTSGLNCDGDFPGIGGKANPNESNRLFFGGGGGAGHDNNGSGTAGGNGGGMVIVLAKKITSNGHSISANGKSALMATGDGGGGGGAGGTIMVVAEEITDQLIVSAIGGQGGFVQNPTDRCIGPGGGGSGGRFISNINSNIDLNITGGLPGENMTVSSQCGDPSNGASQGQNGLQTTFGGIPFSDEVPIPFAIVSHPNNTQVCENDFAYFEFLVEGNFLDYQWQVNDGNGWQDIASGSGYSGEQTPILEIPNVISTLDGLYYRCMVSGPCILDIQSSSAILTVESEPEATFSFNYLGNGLYGFENNSTNATSFLWDFGDGMFSSEINPDHLYLTDGQYVVTLTAINNCGEMMTTQSILVGGFPIAAFSSTYFGCVPVEVQFQDQSTGENIQSYFWEFEGGNPSTSNLQNPFVTYTQPGEYDVSLTIQNTFGEHTVVKNDYIEILAAPQIGFDFLVDSLTVYFSNNSTGATYYVWDFGDGNSSNEFEPTHTYTQGGSYQITLNAGNSACGSVVSQQVIIDTPNAVMESNLPAFTIYPNPFSDEINISFKETQSDRIEVTLFDLNGRFLQSGRVSRGIVRLYPNNIAEGVYLLRIQDVSISAYVKVLKLDGR